jgi:hypothetical protein
MPETFSYNPFFLNASGQTEAIGPIETQLQGHLKANGIAGAHGAYDDGVTIAVR